GGLLEGEVARLAGEGAHRGGDVLGEGAPGEEVLADVADHLVTGLELRHGPAGADDLTGDVPARDHREHRLEHRVEVALAALPVDRIDGRRPHPDEHRVGADPGFVDLSVGQYLGAAVLCVADRLHASTLRGGGAGRKRNGGISAYRGPDHVRSAPWTTYRTVGLIVRVLFACPPAPRGAPASRPDSISTGCAACSNGNGPAW